METQRWASAGGLVLVKTSWPKGLVLPKLKDENLNLNRAAEPVRFRVRHWLCVYSIANVSVFTDCPRIIELSRESLATRFGVTRS